MKRAGSPKRNKYHEKKFFKSSNITNWWGYKLFEVTINVLLLFTNNLNSCDLGVSVTF